MPATARPARMSLADVYATYFQNDYCIGCGEERPCYTDTETGGTLCLDCIETECEAAQFGLHYTDPLPEPDLCVPTPDAGNGGYDRTNPKLRTIGTR